MKAPKIWVCPSSLWYFFLAAILAVPLFAAVLVEFFPTVNASPTVVTYVRGVLHVTIPYHSVHSGDGTLKVEVLNPEDEVLGSAATRVGIQAGYGRWQESIQLNKTLGVDDLEWHRVRYRFEYGDGKTAALEGTESISQILRTPVVHILGQQSYLSGGQAAVRVIVTDWKNGGRGHWICGRRAGRGGRWGHGRSRGWRDPEGSTRPRCRVRGVCAAPQSHGSDGGGRRVARGEHRDVRKGKG